MLLFASYAFSSSASERWASKLPSALLPLFWLVLADPICWLVADGIRNLCLVGVRAVVLHDAGKVEIADVGGCCFALSESDVGKPRAAAALKPLAAINEDVAVSVHEGSIDEKLLSQFQRACLP